MINTNPATEKAAPAVFRTVEELRAYVKGERQNGKVVALVPTMGALHDGHLQLVREGLARADIVIATIFVNPTQFAPHEDLDAYPRTWDADLEKLSKTGAHAIFHPSGTEMYPEDFSTAVSVSGVSAPLEGEFRPHFFGGVATIVCKLLLQALPDIALFGEKDYQQLQVVKTMVRDLNIPSEIIGVTTVRDENGLALSSRNAYLDEEQYKIACALNKTLYTIADKIETTRQIEELESWGAQQLLDAGFDKVDYLAIRDASTLQAPEDISNLRILAAAWLGKARLIDNIPVLS